MLTENENADIKTDTIELKSQNIKSLNFCSLITNIQISWRLIYTKGGEHWAMWREVHACILMKNTVVIAKTLA